MADENSKEPNDPNTKPKEDSKVEVSSSQVDMARQLNEVLAKVSDRLQQIKELTKSQADLVMSMSQSFASMQENLSDMSASSASITEGLNEVANNVIESVSPESITEIGKSLESVSDSVSKGLTENSKNLTDLNKSVLNTSKEFANVGDDLLGVTKDLDSNLNKVNEDILSFRENTKDLVVEAGLFTKAMIYLKDKIKELMAGIAGSFINIVKGGLGMFKTVIDSIGSLVGAATQFVKFSLTIPFTIAQEAAKLGGQIREDLVEVIGQSAEDLKESFDFESSIGKGIKDMTSRGKGMLMAFQSPSNELVKLFGMGADGIANMIKELGTNIAAMGHFSELFGRSIMGDGKRLKNFTKMVRAFGLSSEDIHYMALDAANNMEHINVRMARLGVTLENVSKEFGVDRKRLSKNFMIMRKDITQFGHLSDEEIARTTARLTQMRVKLEDAAAVFKKFSTFEDAANSVAMLSQTFGMNLDAFDIIQAKNPEDIINMFRNSMLETGRAFEDLNRFEKDLMAQHTGMTAESLSALMHYRDLGLTHQQAVDKMASERPEAKQMESLKKLNSAIKEVQKVMTFDSPFKAFASGLAENSTLSGELKDVMVALSKGYEGIYNYAKGLDAKTWEGLVKPINAIVRIMLGIFKSDEFKNGLVSAVEIISGFIGEVFNFDQPIKALQNEAASVANAGADAAKGFLGIAKANEKNTSQLVSLSGRIMGAIIKGAAIGFTALIRSVTDGIKYLKGKMDLADPHKNLIESFFGWNPGDVQKMGNALKNAITDFFSQSDGMISLTGWLIEGMTDIFGVIVGIFGGALAAGIDKILGTKFSSNPSLSLKKTTLKSQRKSATETLQDVSTALHEGNDMDRNSVASLIHDLSDKASTVKDPGQKAKLQTAIEGLKTRFVEEGNTEDDFRNVALQTATIMQGINDGQYKGRDLSSISQINAQDFSTISDTPGEIGAWVGGGAAAATGIGLATGMIAMPAAAASVLPFLAAIPGVNVVTGVALGTAAAAYAGYKIFQGVSEWLTAEEPAAITHAREFDEYLDEKLIGKIIPRLLDGDDFSNHFDNIYFRSFWSNYGEEITAAAKKSKNNKINIISPEHENGSFASSPYYQQIFKDHIKHGKRTALAEQAKLLMPEKPDEPGKEMTKGSPKGVKTTQDLEYLNKYININESKSILNNLLDSVSLPKLFGEENSATTIASSNYSGAAKIQTNNTNKLTKQKAEEQCNKINAIKKKLEEQGFEVTSDFVFTKEIIDKLMKLMAQNNLVRILGMPEYTNGVFSLASEAIGSRCFNIGSDNSMPTTEIVQPSGS